MLVLEGFLTTQIHCIAYGMGKDNTLLMNISKKSKNPAIFYYYIFYIAMHCVIPPGKKIIVSLGARKRQRR
jgi:hypothetical protein